MKDIDTFVCYLPESNRQWIDDLRQDLSKEPVNSRFFVVEPGCLTRSRKLGYALGSAKYVSYFDWDDRTVPGAYEKLLEVMESDPLIPYAFTGEENTDIDLNTECISIPGSQFSFRDLVADPQYAHSTKIFRRELLMHVLDRLSPSIITSDWELAVLLADWAMSNGYKTPAPVRVVGRRQRFRPDSASRIKRTEYDKFLMQKHFKELYCDRPDRYDKWDAGKTKQQIFFEQFKKHYTESLVFKPRNK